LGGMKKDDIKFLVFMFVICTFWITINILAKQWKVITILKEDSKKIDYIYQTLKTAESVQVLDSDIK
jgi:hypothetical protein